VSSWLAEVRAAPPAPIFVAVTHGGVLRVARACLAGAALETMRPPVTPNGVLWRVELRSGEVQEVSLPSA
jgi:broad specificity phosphatase PhoE